MSSVQVYEEVLRAGAGGTGNQELRISRLLMLEIFPHDCQHFSGGHIIPATSKLQDSIHRAERVRGLPSPSQCDRLIMYLNAFVGKKRHLAIP